jgi:phosphate transport system permease protein
MPDRETPLPPGTEQPDELDGTKPITEVQSEELPAPRVGGETLTFGDHRPVVGSAEPMAISGLDDTPPVSGAGMTSSGSGRARVADRIFFGMASGSGIFVILLVVLVAAFLLKEAIPSIVDDKSNFLTSRDWITDANNLHFGIAGLLWTTVLTSLIGMVIAVPIAIGIALFITNYAPSRAARPIAFVIDLLAAIPSIIYGIWGVTILSPKLEPVQRALYHLGGFPIFKDKGFLNGTIFDGGVVLAIMILPIVTAISRDVFERTPRQNIEAAWALGATRWEMIRLAVLPYGRPGVVSGSMLGLGRALGETIAISLILSAPAAGAPFTVSMFSGGETFASKIANNASEFTDHKSTGAYIAAGLVLFILTFIVNAAARAIVNRRREFS